MKKSLLILFLCATSANAQDASNLHDGYMLCTKRYVEHDELLKKTHKWQAGYETCDKIVAAYEASIVPVVPPVKAEEHKSQINTIAKSIKK